MNFSRRGFVRERANRRCEYCQYPDVIRSGPFVLDHIFPSSKGGPDLVENLAWSCSACNGHKAASVEGVDSLTGERALLYNPRSQSWLDHFAWSDDHLTVIGQTSFGRATVQRMQLNRESLLKARSVLKTVGLHP